jgi:hypothetical protein
MGIVDVNDSPLKLSKEEKTIREESDTLKDNECKILEKGIVFKDRKLVCKHGKKITVKDI